MYGVADENFGICDVRNANSLWQSDVQMTEYLPARPGWAHRSEIASWRLRRQNFPSRSYREETRFFVSYRARIGGDPPPPPPLPCFNIEVFVTRCRGLPETCVTVSEQLSGCLITYQKFELDIHFFPNVPPMDFLLIPAFPRQKEEN